MKNGGILTVFSQMNFASSGKIIVEPGGKLVVDGGILTNACDGELWQGIEVHGNRLKLQNETNQGVVELKNNARIENAICGIRAGKSERTLRFYPTYLYSGGGIIYAKDAHFVNNQNAVCFAPFSGGTNVYGHYIDNNSYFKNCEFILDDGSLFDEPAKAQVELQGVCGVFFQNSRFADNRSAKRKVTNGIYANNASMRVGSAYWSFPLSGGGMGYDGCEFSGFDRAIYIQSSGIHQSKIYFSKFTDNSIGIDCYGSNGLLVEGCKFHIPDFVYPNSQRLHGIWVEESSGFSITNNYFSGGSGTGIYFKENGFGNHFVKSNTFNHLCIACSVEGVNADISQYESQGLVFQCNSFSNNDIDININEDSQIRSFQSGENNRATGNIFSNSNYNIYNSSKFFIYYNFFGHNGTHHVNHVYEKYPTTVNLISKDYVACQSHGYGEDSYYHIAILLDINEWNDLYLKAKKAHKNGMDISTENGFGDNSIDWGNQEIKEILERLRDYDFDQYIRILDDGQIEVRDTEIHFPESEPLSQQVFLCVYLTNIRGIIDEICYKALELLSSSIEDDSNPEDNNIEQYRTWISRLNTIESKYLMMESYMDTYEFDMADTKLEEIYASFVSADGTSLYEETNMEIFEDYRKYFRLSREYREFIINHEDDEEEIPPHILDELRDLSYHNNIAGIKSASLLEMMSMEVTDCIWMDHRLYCIHPNCIAWGIGLQKNASENSPINEEDLTDKNNIYVNVYPNPANNTVFIELDKMPETSVYYQLYDIQGKGLQSGNFSSQKQELDIFSLSKGLYFISVTIENQSKITRKIAKG